MNKLNKPSGPPIPDGKSLDSLTVAQVTDVKLSAAAPTAGRAECVLFWDDAFDGEQMTIYRGWSYIGDHWNDQISSIVINYGIWTFFEHFNFNQNGAQPGYAVTLGPGRYDYVEKFGIRNDSITSIRLDALTT